MGLICGVIGIVLALWLKVTDIRPGKKYPGKALAGFIFSIIAIALTMFFFYSLINYYDLLRDPVKVPDQSADLPDAAAASDAAANARQIN